MRICVHDFAGHPFQIELSRALARRGHVVRHVYCASHRSTPVSAGGDNQTPGLEVTGIRLSQELQKGALLTRWRQEREYGVLAAASTIEFAPEVTISANMPLDAQSRIIGACRTLNAGFVFWLQDLIGLATYRLLRRRLGLAGRIIGRHYARMERNQLLESDRIVLLTEDFQPILQEWRIPSDRLHVIHNWATLENLPVRPKDNAWSRSHDLTDKRCFVYTGTLGMKHNPDLLLRLSLHFQNQSNVRVVVLSQGAGADWLHAKKRELEVSNLILLDYEPYERVPDVLATADVLVAILEPGAGIFSVPSKVLSYLCAQRALLLAIPAENLAARIVSRLRAGMVVDPLDVEALLKSAETMIGDPELLRQMGARARAHAEQNFDIEIITDRFEAVLQAARAQAKSALAS